MQQLQEVPYVCRYCGKSTFSFKCNCQNKVTSKIVWDADIRRKLKYAKKNGKNKD